MQTTLLYWLKQRKTWNFKLIRKKIKGESAKSGLHLNIKKTKVMTTEDTAEYIVDNEEIENTTNFVFQCMDVKAGQQERKRIDAFEL